MWKGSLKQTSGGLTKNEIEVNKCGRLVSSKLSAQGKKDCHVAFPRRAGNPTDWHLNLRRSGAILQSTNNAWPNVYGGECGDNSN